MTTNPSTGAPVSVEPAPAGAGAPTSRRPLGLRVEQVTDPSAPPARRGKWQIVRADGVHVATCNTRAAAKRMAASIETLHRLGAKLGTR